MFLSFRSFEQLALALKTFCPEIFQDRWATAPLTPPRMDHNHDDFDKEEFAIERKSLQHFIAVTDRPAEEGIKMRKEGHP